jgi:hypothetical protein
MAVRPRIVFDTTGINELENGGFGSEPLMRALECGYDVILTAMSADEIISTRSPMRREALLFRFGRLFVLGQVHLACARDHPTARLAVVGCAG